MCFGVNERWVGFAGVIRAGVTRGFGAGADRLMVLLSELVPAASCKVRAFAFVVYTVQHACTHKKNGTVSDRETHRSLCSQSKAGKGPSRGQARLHCGLCHTG
jgi:hypothetical protein